MCASHLNLALLIFSIAPSSLILSCSLLSYPILKVSEVDPDVFDAVLAAVVADDGEEEPTIEERKLAKKKQKGEKRKRVDFEDAEEDEDEGEEDGGKITNCLLMLHTTMFTLCCAVL